MSDYDYGNARLRAMKARLLTPRAMEQLAEAGSLAGLVTALIKTAYRKPVEAALTRASGMDGLAEAFRADLVAALQKVRSFYPGEARANIAIFLRAYDIHNLKAILRGLSKNAPPGEIHNTLLPVGDLPDPLLAELARAASPRGVIDALASLNLPIAQPLLKLRAVRPGAETLEMELALERWYYQAALQACSQADHPAENLTAALQLEADLANLLTILRFVYSPAERKLLRERFGTEALADLFVGPGRLSFARLNRAAEQETLELAVSQLAGTLYAPALSAGSTAFARSGRLSEFEKHLRLFRLTWLARLIPKDPLGIGVFLGYLGLKISEIQNLRWIAQAISIGLKPEGIRAELEFAG